MFNIRSEAMFFIRIKPGVYSNVVLCISQSKKYNDKTSIQPFNSGALPCLGLDMRKNESLYFILYLIFLFPYMCSYLFILTSAVNYLYF